MFIRIYEFFKNHPRKRVFCNESLSNLGNVLQRNLRVDRARECFFRVSGGTNFEKHSAQRQPSWRLRAFDVCTGRPKKTLDTSLISQLFLLFNLNKRLFFRDGEPQCSFGNIQNEGSKNRVDI